MANKKGRSTKVNKNMAIIVIALTAVLAVLLVAVLTLRGLPGREKTPETTEPETTETNQTTPPAQETLPAETVPQSTVVIVDQIDGTYEQWLAAGMVMVLPLEYPDFDGLEIYTTGATPLADKQQSQGVYLRFTSGGEQVILHAAPLEAERSEAGSRDLSTMQTGFATLDAVSGEGLDFASMEQLTLESLSGHIAQVMLPSVYQR